MKITQMLMNMENEDGEKKMLSACKYYRDVMTRIAKRFHGGTGGCKIFFFFQQTGTLQP